MFSWNLLYHLLISPYKGHKLPNNILSFFLKKKKYFLIFIPFILTPPFEFSMENQYNDRI
ncbi:hypothetical protein HMPREF2805_03625 [Streptococcus sp. HMSC034E03]|nr:hypothetical protein HMPREF2805_03625 [Streptococcus sp. HMSC034E03]